ncbi:MAG: HYR domain-containing protein, partial [Saprospiraceae bacterium]
AGPDFVACPGDTTLQLPSGTCIATLDFQVAATDDCSGVDAIVSNQIDNQFDPGTTTVVYTATDMVGNSSLCAFEVSVIADNILDITCPSSKTVNAADTACSAIVTWNSPVLNGVCDFTNLMITTTHTPGDTFLVGPPVTVVYTVQDTVNGMLASCSFKITVADTTRPVLQCPADVNVSADSVVNCQALVSFAIATVSDNCDQSLDFDSDYHSGDPFGTGVTTVTYIASDDFSNSAACTFTITVPDLVPPVLSCPLDIVGSVTPDSCNALVQWALPQPFDDCDPNQIPAVSDYLSGGLFPMGATVVTYTAEDNAGNVASCTFSVTVTDDQFPSLTPCPADILVQLPVDQCDTTLTWVEPTAADNCGQPTLNVNLPPGNSFPTGTTVVLYTAFDDANNTVSCTFKVTVVDQVAPVFGPCPQDTVVSTTDPCGVIYTWAIPPATDNCTPDSSLVFSTSKMTTDSFQIGITTVVIGVEDKSGNSATCSFEVTVQSTVVPQFINVPDSIVLNTLGCTAVATWNPPTIAGFCQMPALTSNYEPGDTFPVGLTTVIYTATDALGGITTATFKVIVRESVPPQIDCPTADIVVSVTGAIISDPGGFLTSADTANGCTGVVLEFADPTAMDNCGDALVLPEAGLSSGDIFPAGTTVLTFKAFDGSDNTTTCSFNIVVQALAALTPVVDPNPGCPGEVVTLTVQSIPGATYTWTGPPSFVTQNSPMLTFPNLQPGNTGTYSVIASLNGCSTPVGFAQVQMVSKPDAMNDLEFVIDPNTTDTFNVLLNDVILLPVDIAVTQLSQLQGLVYLGDGKFIYTAGSEPGRVSFIYQICSMACPDVQFCDMATVTITIKDAKCSFIPNIFTPNGDGVNDWLEIPCLDGGFYPKNSMVVYNQWGDKVYEAAPYENDETKAWRGTLDGESGKDLPDGVYYYVFRAGPQEPTIKGFIELYR